MTVEDPQGEFDLLREVEQARRLLSNTKELVLESFEKIKSGDLSKDQAQKLKAASGNYHSALNAMAKHEADLGKHSRAIRAVLQGGALDLDGARTETLERIARFRDRG